MGRIWAIARQTIAEGMRMKIALIFIVVIGLVLVGLPISLRDENAISDAVQSFLSFSLGSLIFLLSLLTIFLSRSLSDEMVNRQILILMTKPVPRWQFITGKWLGIVMLNFGLLMFAGLSIYGGTWLMAQMKPRDEPDAQRLANEVLTSRHAVKCQVPDFRALAERLYQDNLESGVYAEAINLIPFQEKGRLAAEQAARWRTLAPLESRDFEFTDVRCARREDKYLQIRYKAEVWDYAPDEILRAEWWVGNPDKQTPVYFIPRRDVMARYQTIQVPTNAVAADRTLNVRLINRNPFEGEPQQPNIINFASSDDIEVLFQVGSFGGNFIRYLSLEGCKLAFLAAVAVLAACLFSFPVACLVCFTFLALANMSGFLNDAAFFLEGEGVPGLFKHCVNILYTVVFFLVPDFAHYSGLEQLVDGRNVTLRWVLSGLLNLVLVGTTAVMLLACIVFQRREVAEVSV